MTGPVDKEKTFPVYLLRRWSKEEHRNYYRLSLKTEDGGYTMDPHDQTPGPEFHAFQPVAGRADLVQVYEHSADTKIPGVRRYIYDFASDAHDGWGKGTAVFCAITPQTGEQALVGSIKGNNAMLYARDWIASHGDGLSKIVQGLRKENVDRAVVDRFNQFFKDMPIEVKYYTMGAGIHGGYGFGTAGMEAGAIWKAEDFGQVPIREPLADYSIEWITFGGATGLDLGGSADVLAIGTWFGDISQIEGACNGITLTGQFGVGVSVTLTWDGSWLGANYTSHPIGVTAVVAVGVEAGLGAFYNASATQFWNRRKNFPKS